jgi:hypothetical protein
LSIGCQYIADELITKILRFGLRELLNLKDLVEVAIAGYQPLLRTLEISLG